MCLAALWSPVGKGTSAVVAGPEGPVFAGPTFLAEYAKAVSLFLVSTHFSLSLPLILLNHATIYRNTPNVAHVILNIPAQGVKTSSHRDMGYGSCRKKT